MVPNLERPSHPKAQNFFESAYVGRSALKSAKSARSISQYNIKCFQPNRVNFVRTGRGRFNEQLPQNQWEEGSTASRKSASAYRRKRQPGKAEAQRPSYEDQVS